MLINLNEDIANYKGIQKDPSFIYIDNVVNKNLNTVSNYIRSSAMAVRNDHLLVKIIQSLAINTTLYDDELFHRVASNSTGLASSMGLTCSMRQGKPHYKQFSTSGTEYILATKESFNHAIPWDALEPVKFLYHTNTNVNCMLGTSRADDSSDMFISINIPMLAVQYAHWRRWVVSTGAEQSILHFVMKYPIVNAIKSYINISQFNRHYYRLSANDIPNEEKFGAIQLGNIESQLDRSNLKIINMLTKQKTTILQSLEYLPMFFGESAKSLLDFPETFGRQDKWFTDIAQMPYLNFGLHVSGLSGGTLDQYLLSKLERDIVAFKYDRTIDSLPKVNSADLYENYVDPLYQRISDML